jgi:hypothetical protein
MKHLRGGEIGGDYNIAVKNFCLNMFLRSSAKAMYSEAMLCNSIKDFAVHTKG